MVEGTDAARRRILVTGASGVFGREIVTRLASAGHQVTGFSRREPSLPDGVDFRAGDIRDLEAVTAAMDGCDVVAHCAWALDAMFDDPAEREINVGGTENVLTAMERTGASRIVFASSSTAYGPRPGMAGTLTEDVELAPHPDHVYGLNKQEVERLLEAAPVDAVSVRASVVVGRRIDNRIRSFLAAPALVGVKGEAQRWQVVHADDVGRLFALACERGPSGPVNLATDDVLDGEDVARLLGKRYVQMRRRLLEATIRRLWDLKIVPVGIPDLEFLRHQPILDTTRLREDFGFACAWSGREAIEDTRASLFGLTSSGASVIKLPWRRQYAFDVLPATTPTEDGTELIRGAADEADAGEFDTPVDPRFAVFTATNLSEALPGPATPLSLTSIAPGIQSALVAAADFVGLQGAVGHEARTRFLGIIGHRLRVNARCAASVAELSPGWDAGSITERYLGRHRNEVHVSDSSSLPIDRPKDLKGRARAAAGTGVRAAGAAKGYRANVDEVVTQTARLERLSSDLPAASDARLASLFSLATDVLHQGWAIAGHGAILSGATTNSAEALGGRTGVVGDLEGDLTSAQGLETVRALAAIAGADSVLAAITADRTPGAATRACSASADFERAFNAALTSMGHRGPGESELEAKTFADDPDLLIAAVAGAMGGSVTSTSHRAKQEVRRRARPAAKLARHFTAERERNRDHVVKTIALMRAIVREQGNRLARAGHLDDPGDVYYLASSELFAPPADSHELVRRRRAERDRLSAISLPVAFAAPWHPLATSAFANVGDVIEGVGASPGIATGRVRVVGLDTVREVEPGEVLVARVTDVGYAPMYGHTAAVVTDVGGIMSHAAVVARGVGIPAVVDTGSATRRLRTGMVVTVDGTTGTIAVDRA